MRGRASKFVHVRVFTLQIPPAQSSFPVPQKRAGGAPDGTIVSPAPSVTPLVWGIGSLSAPRRTPQERGGAGPWGQRTALNDLGHAAAPQCDPDVPGGASNVPDVPGGGGGVATDIWCSPWPWADRAPHPHPKPPQHPHQKRGWHGHSDKECGNRGADTGQRNHRLGLSDQACGSPPPPPGAMGCARGCSGIPRIHPRPMAHLHTIESRLSCARTMPCGPPEVRQPRAGHRRSRCPAVMHLPPELGAPGSNPGGSTTRLS